jgi:hypothetical protein
MKPYPKFPNWMNFVAVELQKKGTDANEKSVLPEPIVSSTGDKQ